MLKATGDRAIAEDALARLGIAHLADRLYPELSGGERQMVLIARALARQAAPIVMGEPTASLDFGNQARGCCGGSPGLPRRALPSCSRPTIRAMLSPAPTAWR